MIKIGVLLSFFCLFLTFNAGKILAKNKTVIKITADGFSPRQVTIEKNSTVIFLNENRVDHWPASDFHPTHSIYPEFDPKKPIIPQSAWELQMNKIGIWKYHDHLYPHRKGVIKVVGESDKQKFALFDSLNKFIEQLEYSILMFFSRTKVKDKFINNSNTIKIDDFKKLKAEEQYEYLEKIIKQFGFQNAWEYIYQHDLAHFLGAKIYESEGLSGLSFCNPSFAFGCYHGFSEAAFASNLDKLDELGKSCQQVGHINSGPWASCIHGIGHGVATYFETIKLEESLVICDKLLQGANYCHDGVFMEFALSAPKSLYEVEKKDPLYPCNKIEPIYRQGCARQQPHVMMKYYGLAFRQIADICLKSTDKTIKFHCIDAIGLLIGQKSEGNPQIIINECKLISNIEAPSQCISAAAGEIVFQKYQDWEENAFVGCETLPIQYESFCKKRVQEVIDNYK